MTKTQSQLVIQETSKSSKKCKTASGVTLST